MSGRSKKEIRRNLHRARRLLGFGPTSCFRAAYYVLASRLGKQTFPARLSWGYLSVPANARKLGAGGLIFSRRDGFERHLRPYFCQCDGAFIDIGANFGYWTCFVANQASMANAVIPVIAAFEPSGDNLPFLGANVKHVCSCGAKDIRIVPKALGAREGTVYLCPSNDDPGSTYVAERGEVAVSQITLDAWVKANQFPRIALIKVDVEGYEFDVLSGATETLRLHRPVIICEVFEEYQHRNSRTPEDIFRLLFSLGYSAKMINPGGGEVDCDGFLRDGDYLFKFQERSLEAVPNDAVRDMFERREIC